MRGSLKTKLVLLFTLFTCVPVIIGTVMSAYFSITAMKAVAVSSNSDLSKQISNQIKSSMDHVQEINDTISVMPVVRSMDAAVMKQVIGDIQKKNTQFELIAVLDQNGQQIVRTSGQNTLRADREYFQKSKQGETFFSEAYISGTTNKLCLTISTPIYDESGNVIGVVASDVSLDYLWKIADMVTIGESGYIDIVDNKATILAHPQKERIQEKEKFSQYGYVQKVMQGESGSIEDISSIGEKSLITYAPVEKYNWGVVVYEPTSEVYQSVIQNSLLMLGIVVLSMIISIFAAFKIAESIVAPIEALVEAAQRISSGDLSHVIHIKGAVEINRLIEQFNLMVAHLRSLILKTTEASETVSAASQQLAASIDAVGRSAEEVSANIKQTVQSTNEKVKLSASSVSAIRAMVQSIDMAAASAQDAAKAAIESKESANRGSLQSDEAIQKIVCVQKGVNESAHVIDSLGEKSRQIGKIIDTISGIARQTNLLALNAAIEAARAGEHGKGFAVVAEEVSKLADQSEVAAREISDIINAIKTQTMTAVDKMDEGCKEVDLGVISVQKSVDSFNEIHSAIGNVNERVNHILQLSTEQKEGSTAVENAVHEISDFLHTNAEGFKRVGEISEEQNIAVQEVKAAAADLAKMAMELRTEISKFSV